MRFQQLITGLLSTATVISLAQVPGLSAPIYKTPTHPTLSEVALMYPSAAPAVTAPSSPSLPFQTPTHPLLSEVSGLSQFYATAAGLPVAEYQVPTHPRLWEIGNLQARGATKFKVRIENISSKDEFTASNGNHWTLDYSPGFWELTDGNNPVFTEGQKDRGQGLEAIAEDGNPMMLAKSLSNYTGGVFNTPVGAAKAAGIRPGQAFEFTVKAMPGQKLALVTMFGQSNDWFYAPSGAGIALFDASGRPIAGDVSNQIMLWNAGTEVDEEPGVGPTQGPRQKMPNTGVDENGIVQMIQNGTVYSNASQVMRVTVTPEG
jgi:hypothetical protein